MNQRKKGDNTQKKNPHGLTKNQHVLPKRSIERFAGVDGLVSVFFKEGKRRSEVDRIHPKRELFCVPRV